MPCGLMALCSEARTSLLDWCWPTWPCGFPQMLREHKTKCCREVAVQENRNCSAGKQKLQCRKPKIAVQEKYNIHEHSRKMQETNKCSAGKVQDKCNIADKMQCNMFWFRVNCVVVLGHGCCNVGLPILTTCVCSQHPCVAV